MSGGGQTGPSYTSHLSPAVKSLTSCPQKPDVTQSEGCSVSPTPLTCTEAG